MSKRRRETDTNEQSFQGDDGADEDTTNPVVFEKYAKTDISTDETNSKENSEISVSTEQLLQMAKLQSKKTEIIMDTEEKAEKPELKAQKSLDGDDSASDRGSVAEETNSHLFQELLDVVLKMKDNNGRMICELFLKLPPRQQYPEYFKVIKEPIDLKMIYSNIKNNRYTSLDDLEKDLNLLAKNAHAFNEPGSQVYKDATAIKKIVAVKRLEIEHMLSGAKSSKRLRSKRSTTKMCPTISALLSESDDEDEELLNDATQLMEEGDEKEDGNDEQDGPFLLLYNSIRAYADTTGRVLSEAFMRLPSKRAYPDYYKIIKNPIGLLKIGSNVKNNYYESLNDLVLEIQQCFENAKTYNETDSMLYQDAVLLQDVLNKKKPEFEKLCIEKDIPLIKPMKEKLPRRNDPMNVEDDEAIVAKDTPGGKGRKFGKKQSEMDLLKKRMKEMYDAVVNYQDDSGRFLSELFLDLPSAELYPDYYKIISEPTCLHMIDKNVREGKYQTENQFLLDFEIMFENAKHYNEVKSQVHQDALTLDKVLKKKRKSLGRPAFSSVESSPLLSSSAKQSSTAAKQSTPTKSRYHSPKVPQAITSSDVKELCKELYNSVKDYTDSTGRYLCGIFQKLPPKADYPDYYALIKRPIDMMKISSKVHAEQYGTLEECFQDFVLMFDNACKYNDPDSQVYKDSLVLLRELFATKLELVGDYELNVPDVTEIVQKMLEEVYNVVINHKDDDGRCYSDSLIKLATVKRQDHPEKRAILSLSTIGKLVQKRYYKRLDKFQDDLFAFFENARTHRFDSEIYDDAVELQLFYVQQRDRLCKDGERFVSPAISQTKRHLQHELDEERKRKMRSEISNVVNVHAEKTMKDDCKPLSEVNVKDIVVTIGDFVHVEAAGDRFIISVEKIWSDVQEQQWIYGTWFYRPKQTMYEKGRKFIEKEVFRSDRKSAVQVDKILSQCHVMYVRNYSRSRPHDFDDDDVYVCECAYNSSLHLFKKIKSWPGGHGHTMRYVPRDQPLLLTRAPVDPIDPGIVMKNDDEDLITSLMQVVDEKKNIPVDVPNNENAVHFEQFITETGCYKLGDTVFCLCDEGYSIIARIDKIWTDRTGVTYFCGSSFIPPDDTQHLPTHMFYDKEVFHIAMEEVHRMCDIEGKCFVLPIREYVRYRATDVPEEDVFLCESRYDEDDGGHYRKLKGLKRPTLSTNVYEEEFYFFEEHLNPNKRPSPLLVKNLSDLNRGDRIVSPSLSADDSESGKSAKKRSRAQSGFLLYSAERRGALRKQYPDYGFGDISRLVGTEWKNLSPMKKEEWESRSINNSITRSQSSITTSSPAASIYPVMVYECLWEGCDYQYEDLNELMIHLLESGGHLVKLEDGTCPCKWRGCENVKRGMRPFNTLTKLIRHCREVHLKAPPRRVELHERSKNYFPRNQAAVQPEHLPPEPVSKNQNVVTAATNQQAFIGVVPSPTPSQVMATGVVGMSPVLLDQQFANVLRMPAPVIPQNMMNVSNSGQESQLGTPQNIPIRPTAMISGAAHGNQFAQMSSLASTSMIQQQFVNTIQPYPQVYQQQDPLLTPFTSNIPSTLSPQQIQLSQQRTQVPAQNSSFSMQKSQPLDTQTTEEQMAPLFHNPPPRQQKLRHSDAYLRYIEGLRDGTPHLSNWNPNKPDVSRLTPQQQSQLPAQWLGSAYYPHSSTVDALWALRKHMLNDTLKLAKFSQNTAV
ncbi:protein polybromo-1-like isoform X2 [Xenia sp. Carnegie-2017]|uniref:protein polybromo-1-like isoform X2 n=1 Tax=Xenia sp. Carnegie-2017 TaxID=2897299 RepID=UPI001F03970F|nr:protein polybromo-1-like isoform X2 [Xenia sp. Carnegie-2017]